MKRLRPRFSIRTLAILITLICCYAACWGPTKRRGVEDVMKHTTEGKPDPTSYVYVGPGEPPLAPFLYTRPVPEFPCILTDVILGRDIKSRRYYFWFFGYVAKLPYERNIADTSRPLPTYGPGYRGILPPL